MLCVNGGNDDGADGDGDDEDGMWGGELSRIRRRGCLGQLIISSLRCSLENHTTTAAEQSHSQLYFITQKYNVESIKNHTNVLYFLGIPEYNCKMESHHQLYFLSDTIQGKSHQIIYFFTQNQSKL